MDVFITAGAEPGRESEPGFLWNTRDSFLNVVARRHEATRARPRGHRDIPTSGTSSPDLSSILAGRARSCRSPLPSERCEQPRRTRRSTKPRAGRVPLLVSSAQLELNVD